MGELAPHNEARWYSGQGKCGGCARKAHVLIRGDLSDVAVLAEAHVPAGPTGRPRSRRARSCRLARANQAVEPQIAQRAAQQCVGVIGQKSAEAVVAAAVKAVKGRTRKHKEER